MQASKPGWLDQLESSMARDVLAKPVCSSRRNTRRSNSRLKGNMKGRWRGQAGRAGGCPERGKNMAQEVWSVNTEHAKHLRYSLLPSYGICPGVSESHLVNKDLQPMWQLPSWLRHSAPLGHIIQSSSFLQKLVV